MQLSTLAFKQSLYRYFRAEVSTASLHGADMRLEECMI